MDSNRLSREDIYRRIQELPSDQRAAAEALVRKAFQNSRTRLFRDVPVDKERWLFKHFGHYFQSSSGRYLPLAPHHKEFWDWVWQMRPGQWQPTFLAVWPRDGGKSTSTELACTVCATFGLRRYGLYVGGTQDQADDHVQTVADQLSHRNLGIQRAVGKFGEVKGWRRNRLRTSDGFTLDAVGLDTATRGVKIEAQRPDLIIIDDIDDQNASIDVINRRERALTRKILPTGSDSLVVIGVQNLPHPDGIFSRLVDGRADYLLDRVISGPHPALNNFDYETDIDEETGQRHVRIISGQPTWEGLNVEICSTIINTIGIRSFLVEHQHQTDLLLGLMFQKHWFPVVEDWPREVSLVRYWDLAATEPTKGRDPDYTAGLLMAEHRGRFWIVDVQKFRLSPGQVEDRIRQTAVLDGQRVRIYIEQEPGASGKNTIDHYQREVLKGFDMRGASVSGSKSERARPASASAEAGNISIVKGKWNSDFLDEIEGFPNGRHDDQVDAFSGAFNKLAGDNIIIAGASGTTRANPFAIS